VDGESHSGKTTRQVHTAWSDEWDASGAPKPLPMPYQQVLTADLLAGVEEHRIEPLIYTFAGQSIAWFNEQGTFDEMVAQLIDETKDALDALAGRAGLRRSCTRWPIAALPSFWLRPACCPMRQQEMSSIAFPIPERITATPLSDAQKRLVRVPNNC
jgi:hypothetical protein